MFTPGFIPTISESCGNWIFKNKVTGEVRTFYCNSPKCAHEECNLAWCRKRVAIANDLVRRYGLTRFFTLTIDRSLTKKKAWELMPYFWSKFRKRMKRYGETEGKDFKFFAVLEATKSGFPHVHGFWNLWIKKDKLIEIWRKCAPGYIVDVKAVRDDEDASRYLGEGVTKYLGKQQSIDGARLAGHRARVMWRSAGLLTEKELDKKARKGYSEWTLLKEGTEYEAEQERRNLEGTHRADTEESAEPGGKDMEAEVRSLQHVKDKEVARATGEDKLRNTEREGEVIREETNKNNAGAIRAREQSISHSSVPNEVSGTIRCDSSERGPRGRP